MQFEKFFRALSYAAAFCGFLALWVSGSFGVVGTALFTAAFVGAWFLEDTRWQIPERPGTILIVLAVPVYYLGWRSGFFEVSGSESRLPVALAYLILSLTVVKLFQLKSDRDWVFLYLMAFFEVLLGAGLSISALYLASFVAFAFMMACVMLAFEMRKSARKVPDAAATKKEASVAERLDGFRSRRIPLSAAILVFFVVLLAAPLFFFLPRVGGAGLGSGRGHVARTGFSDSVRLGDIGAIQQSDEVVMRVRLARKNEMPSFIRWRGVALDTFEDNTWSRSSKGIVQPLNRSERDIIPVDEVVNRANLVQQTIYLEPLDHPVLFGLSRIVGIQGGFPFLNRDTEGGLTFPRAGERVSYQVLSDTSLPSEVDLRADSAPYAIGDARYLNLPGHLDPRIAELARSVTTATRNRYDAARAIERYLQSRFGYTLDIKVGGSDPLADFLFNVREGHCEYFATAMAIMLRTQGVATRVVNGFQAGEYNDTADAFIVRQRNAHSWVEVYFPKENAWVPFDPTPFAGQNLSTNSSGIAGRVNKYLEALEIIWIQYFVAFDNQEQRSLFTSIRRSVSDLNTRSSSWTRSITANLADWWRRVRGDMGIETSLYAVAFGLGMVMSAAFGLIVFVWLVRKIVKWEVWRRIRDRVLGGRSVSIVEFYDRMQRILASKGFKRLAHQTPLEFAYEIGIPEAVRVTEKYNRVRFGENYLSISESDQIDNWLETLEKDPTTKAPRHRMI